MPMRVRPSGSKRRKCSAQAARGQMRQVDVLRNCHSTTCWIYLESCPRMPCPAQQLQDLPNASLKA